jgi:Rrf2 family protein
MIEIAKQADRNIPVSLHQVAQQGALPRRYLEQLVIGLKNASLIRGVSGKVGGYCLTRPAGEIQIGAIVEAAIGPVNIVDCVSDPRLCLKADVCECRLLWTLINGRISDVLNEFSLADMLDKKWYRLMSRQIMQRPAGSSPLRKPRSTPTSGATQ